MNTLKPACIGLSFSLEMPQAKRWRIHC